MIASRAGWFAAYAKMAALLGLAMLVFLFATEPTPRAEVAINKPGTRWDAFQQWLATAVTGPFADFMRRPLWAVILIFVLGYKLGEAMAGVMAMPLYISLGFSLEQIAAVSKLVGFFATVVGALIGGVITAKLGILRELVLCGVLQSLGNLFYVLHGGGLVFCIALGSATVGPVHQRFHVGLAEPPLVLEVPVLRVREPRWHFPGENRRLDRLRPGAGLLIVHERHRSDFTGAMAVAALVPYLSDLCSPAFTATQYALLSSLAAVGRTMVASSGGVLADKLGWVQFFLLTTVVTIPALLLLAWIAKRGAALPRHDSMLTASAGS
jgi:PAT family beta-lactamase induction signal transducer AmpG